MRRIAFTFLLWGCLLLVTVTTNRVNRRRVLSQHAKNRLPILSRKENKKQISKTEPAHLVFFDVFDSLSGVQNGFSLNEYLDREPKLNLKLKNQKAKDDFCRKTAQRYAIQKLLYQELKRQHLKLRAAYRALVQELNAYEQQATKNLFGLNSGYKFKTAPTKTRPIEPSRNGFSLKEWLTDKTSGYNILYKLYSKIKDLAKPVQVQKKFKSSEPDEISNQFLSNDFYEYETPHQTEVEYPLMMSEYENPFYSSYDYGQTFVPQKQESDSQNSGKLDQNVPSILDPEIEVEKELEKDEKQFGLQLPKAIKKKLQKLRDSLKDDKVKDQIHDKDSGEKDQNKTSAEKAKKVVDLLNQKLDAKMNGANKTDNKQSNETTDEKEKDGKTAENDGKTDDSTKNEGKDSENESKDDKEKNENGDKKSEDKNKNDKKDETEKESSKDSGKDDRATDGTTTSEPDVSSTETGGNKEEKGNDGKNGRPKKEAQNLQKKRKATERMSANKSANKHSRRQIIKRPHLQFMPEQEIGP